MCAHGATKRGHHGSGGNSKALSAGSTTKRMHAAAAAEMRYHFLHFGVLQQRKAFKNALGLLLPLWLLPYWCSTLLKGIGARAATAGFEF
jgi:hypothetical protein